MINLTPHEISMRTHEGATHVVPPSGTVARVETREEPVGLITGVPLVVRQFGEIIGLPDNPHGETLIVSSMVLDAAIRCNHPELTRMAAPDSGKTAIRNAAGQVEAVTQLVVAPRE